MDRQGLIKQRILKVLDEDGPLTREDLEGQVHGYLHSTHGEHFTMRSVDDLGSKENEICAEIYREIGDMLGEIPY